MNCLNDQGRHFSIPLQFIHSLSHSLIKGIRLVLIALNRGGPRWMKMIGRRKGNKMGRSREIFHSHETTSEKHPHFHSFFYSFHSIDSFPFMDILFHCSFFPSLSHIHLFIQMKIVCIGAAPTGLGAAFRLNELIGEGNEEAKNTEIVFLERVSSSLRSLSSSSLIPLGISCWWSLMYNH